MEQIQRYERCDLWPHIPFADAIGDRPADKAVFAVCLAVLIVVVCFGG